MASHSSWPYPKVLAHRGGGILAPENTLAAIRRGLEHGFHAVEFDVMLTRDGVPILMHDEQRGRTVPGKGDIADLAATELFQLDAGAWFGPGFVGERVPAYADVVAFCKGNGIWMNVEIKPAAGHERQTGRVVADLTRKMFAAEIAARKHGGAVDSLPLLSSFSFEAVQEAQRAAPEIPRAFLVDTVPGDWQERLQEIDAVALHTNQKNLTPALAKAVKAAGYGLFCYTVNDLERAREMLDWGVDGFCTDRIDLISTQFPD
jgi:glycerophosphoryl diester phosphodiesterase